MEEYLIGICYHEPEPWRLFQQGVIEDYESSTGVFITAPSEADAISWGEHIGEALHRFVNGDSSLRWKDSGYFCWIEHEPAVSGWQHCLSFFQHVEAGEMPDLTRMTTDAYEEWQKSNKEPG